MTAAIFLCGSVAARAATWEDIGPLLNERCVHCHSGEYAPLGLRLDTHDGLMKGSENGPVVTEGMPDSGPLIDRLLGRATPQMPLDGPPFLTTSEIDLIRDWITEGAKGPTTEVVAEVSAPSDPRDDGRIVYSEVAPIFGRHCIECHSANSKYDAPPEGLRLDGLERTLRGGERVVVIPGNPEASELLRRIVGLSNPRMPFDGPPWLSDDEIDLIRDWIAGGALNDDGTAARIPVGGRVRFRGMMTGPSEIDGAAFVVTGDSDVRDRPAIGQGAELRGRVGPDGRIEVERLRAR